jgi:hypothetical protein
VVVEQGIYSGPSRAGMVKLFSKLICMTAWVDKSTS